MRPVLIDISRLLGRARESHLPTGVDRVALAQVAHFARQHPDHTHALLTQGDGAAVLDLTRSQAAFALLLDRPPAARARRESHGWIWHARLAGWAWRPRWLAQSVLINAGHRGLEHPAYAHTLRARGAQLLSFIHDLIPVTHPALCRAGETGRHAQRLRTALGGAAVLVNSHHTAAELRAWAAQQGLRVPLLQVAPLGVSAPAHDAPATSSDNPQQPCLVMLGTVEPRKGHRLLLDLWPALVQRCRARGQQPQLIVIGQPGWDCDDLLARLADPAVQALGVQHLPHASDEHVTTELRRARALLMPSAAEGFGLPVAEALALRTPVLAAPLPVLDEIAPGRITRLDTARADDWLDELDRRCADTAAQLAQRRAALADWPAPTWAAHMAVLEGTVQRIAGGHA